MYIIFITWVFFIFISQIYLSLIQLLSHLTRALSLIILYSLNIIITVFIDTANREPRSYKRLPLGCGDERL
jgi:hypothetical protein